MLEVRAFTFLYHTTTLKHEPADKCIVGALLKYQGIVQDTSCHLGKDQVLLVMTSSPHIQCQ